MILDPKNKAVGIRLGFRRLKGVDLEGSNFQGNDEDTFKMMLTAETWGTHVMLCQLTATLHMICGGMRGENNNSSTKNELFSLLRGALIIWCFKTKMLLYLKRHRSKLDLSPLDINFNNVSIIATHHKLFKYNRKCILFIHHCHCSILIRINDQSIKLFSIGKVSNLMI